MSDSYEEQRQKLSQSAQAGHDAQVVKNYIGQLLDREERATITRQIETVRMSPIDPQYVIALAARLDVINSLRAMLDAQIHKGRHDAQTLVAADIYAERSEIED